MKDISPKPFRNKRTSVDKRIQLMDLETAKLSRSISIFQVVPCKYLEDLFQVALVAPELLVDAHDVIVNEGGADIIPLCSGHTHWHPAVTPYTGTGTTLTHSYSDLVHRGSCSRNALMDTTVAAYIRCSEVHRKSGRRI